MKREARLVEIDPLTNTAMTIAIDDLRESADYLKWIFRSKKRRAENFETHGMFFSALIDELDAAIALLEDIRPPDKA